eukprot:SAG25_NODE_14202_length_257_cov_2.367089_1_plen_22_part_10
MQWVRVEMTTGFFMITLYIAFP